jgi:hypothetical protein
MFEPEDDSNSKQNIFLSRLSNLFSRTRRAVKDIALCMHARYGERTQNLTETVYTKFKFHN